MIIFSTVRANEKSKVGFLSDKRRLNVALTRAKRGLIVLGKQSTLQSDDTWNEWFVWAEKNGIIKEQQKFESKLIQEVVVNESDNIGDGEEALDEEKN